MAETDKTQKTEIIAQILFQHYVDSEPHLGARWEEQSKGTQEGYRQAARSALLRYEPDYKPEEYVHMVCEQCGNDSLEPCSNPTCLCFIGTKP